MVKQEGLSSQPPCTLGAPFFAIATWKDKLHSGEEGGCLFFPGKVPN